MKKFLLFWSLVMSFSLLKAQTFTANFTGGAAAIPATSTTQKCFPVTVSGVGVINAATIGLAQVCLNITHPYVDELEIVLTAPDGTVVPLSIQNGGSGNNYNGTCFTATATQSIKFGTAPFAGAFLPEGHLGSVNNGQNANGVWRICVQDRRNGGNGGSLTSFSVTFNNTPAPLPPSLPTCSSTLPSTSSCATATAVCDFNGLCGNTNGSTVQDWPGSGLDGSCFGLQNNSFIKFVASATTASFSVWVPTSSIGGNYNQGGIQMLFFSGTCGSGAVTTHGCYPHILPYSGGRPIVSVVTAAGLTPGNTYYLMIDGFNNDNCTFTIAANSGVNILNISPTAPVICQGNNVNLTASGGNGVFTWSPSTGLSSTTGATVTASPATSTIYTVTSTGIGSCPITKNVTVTVNLRPVITTQPSTTAQNICLNGSVTALSVVATPGSGTITGYQWYSNTTPSTTGGTLIPGATSATYTPLVTATGTLYYYCVITNSNTCSSTSNISGAINVTAIGAPTASATLQPTCITGGTITVTAPLGANFEYSIDGGTFQAGVIFTGLTPGTHNIIVKNITTGCESLATPVTLNAIPNVPAAPTASATLQPTCTNNLGEITVTAPLGANFQYSIDGGSYQTSPVFPNVPPGTHDIRVKNTTTGCESTITQVTINAALNVPAAPTVSVTQQPTCATPSGTITVTAPLGANFQYSIDGGSYQTSPVFTNVAPGPHSIKVKNMTGGCESASTPVTVNAIPTIAVPAASVTLQPTCITGGTITVTAPLGANFEYSIDGGTYQAGVTFTGVTPGTHNIKVKNIITGCESVSTPITVNAIPTIAAPTASATLQPTCITGGTITVTAPLGANFQYSIDGGTYQAGVTFTGVTPGTHNIRVKNIINGCESPATPVILNSLPALPPMPVENVTVTAQCPVVVTITIISPVGVQYLYSFNNGAYVPGNIFTGIGAGNHTVKVKDINTGCESNARPINIAPGLGSPAAPAATVTQPTCAAAGTITITAPIGPSLTYSINGGPFQPGVTFTGLTPGPYSIKVKNTVNNCESAITTVTVNNLPANPLPPVGTVTKQPTCGDNTGTITVTAPTGPNFLYSINGGAFLPGTVFSGLIPNTYNIRVRNVSTSCESAALQLTVNAGLVIPAAPVTTGGSRCGPGTVTLSATGTGTINWYSDATLTNVVATGNTFSPAVTATQIYYVTATGATCTSVATPVTATVNPVPVPVLGANRSVCAGDALILNPGSFSSYTWQNNSIAPTFNVTTSGTYSVTVKNATGCEGTASVKIEVLTDCNDIYFPGAFTPNNDLVNDEFGPLPLNSLPFVKNYNLLIYNRYGQLVFKTNDPYKKWDGKFLGKMLAGNYVWYASYTYRGKSRSTKGSLLIVR